MGALCRYRRWIGRGVAAVALAVPLLAGLAACGFEPLYGRRADGSGLSDRLAAVEIGLIADRSGQILRNHLLDQFQPRGRTGPAHFALEVKLYEPREELAVRRTDEPTRVLYQVNANFVLRELPSNAVVLASSANAGSTFNIDRSEFATLSGERAARENALRVIGEDITRQVALYLSRRDAAKGG